MRTDYKPWVAVVSLVLTAVFVGVKTTPRRRTPLSSAPGSTIPALRRQVMIQRPASSSLLRIGRMPTTFPEITRRRHPHVGKRATTAAAHAASSVVDSRVPVTVVTGFLGSGKTTLLNNILTQSHGKKIAVIENEFGEIGIDQDLVAVAKNTAENDDSILMLNNGCLCCAVRDDLIEMLIELTTKYREKFDHILIETTGLAAVAPIIQAFYADPDVAERAKLDGVVTLVDAKHVHHHLDDETKEETGEGVVNEAMEQIAYADRIVLNKIDLVNDKELESLQKRLRSVNGMAEIVKANRANVGVEYVLDVGGFNLDNIEEQARAEEAQRRNPAAKQEASHDHAHDHHDHAHDHSDHDHDHSHQHATATATAHSHDHDHGHHDHDHDHDHDCGHDQDCGHDHGHHHHGHDHEHDHIHDDRVSSLSLELKGNVDYDKIDMWLGGLLPEIHTDLYRMKGILAVEGYDEKYVFQGIHAMFEGTPHEPWKPGEERKSKIVFIGKDLPKERIEKTFFECAATAELEEASK